MLAFLFSLLALGADKAPSFFKIECKGVGPSISIARAEALDECRKSALSYLQTNFRSKSLVVQTETDAALHEETKAKFDVQGLECLTPSESTLEEDDSVYLSLTCKYDPKNIVFTDSSDQSEPKAQETIESRQNYVEPGKHYPRKKQTLAIATVPQCTSVLVEGSKPQIIRCNKNPTLVVLSDDAQKIVIRANGYKPKELSREKFEGKNEIQVILNP